uniref:Complement C8 gamma chain n=1 Tax=Gallus gallus TaxID=9031 RepID=A0A8V1AKH4_CHICK
MRKGQSPEQSRKAPIGKSQQRLPRNSPGLRHAVTHCRAGGHPRNAPGRKGEPKRLGLPTPVQKARGGSRPPAGTPRPSRARPRGPERRTWVPGHVPGDAVVAVEELLPQELVAGHGAPLPAHEAHREHVGVVQLVGRWFLVGVASRCSYLAENSHRLEATAMTVAVPDGQSLAISTFRKLDGQCWEIRQRYVPEGAHRRFSVRGRGYNSKMEVVVGEADPRSYAIIYYQDSQGLSAKLYGRSSQLSNAIVDKFEQRARAVGLSEDVTHYFPTYGFCDSADDFHILDETEL